MPDLEDPAAKGTLMKPVFFATGQKLAAGQARRRPPRRRWPSGSRRSRNTWFAKAFVNRMWSELVGEGFYEPVDDMGPDRKPAAPETLDFLLGEVRRQRLRHQVADAHDHGHRGLSAAKPLAARSPTHGRSPTNCPQRLRADQLFNALLGRRWASTTRRSAIGEQPPPPDAACRAAAGSSTARSATTPACAATKSPARFRRRCAMMNCAGVEPLDQRRGVRARRWPSCWPTRTTTRRSAVELYLPLPGPRADGRRSWRPAWRTCSRRAIAQRGVRGHPLGAGELDGVFASQISFARSVNQRSVEPDNAVTIAMTIELRHHVDVSPSATGT